MIYLDLNIISTVVNGFIVGGNVRIYDISIDTRDNSKKKGFLFIAIKGNNIDSHSLCIDAVQKGALALLVEFLVPIRISQLIVKDTKIALGNLARWLRIKSGAIVLAITGSTGKTTVKEITSNILKYSNKILYTYGNLNNNIGVPLTLLKLNNSVYDYVILELGISCFNDMSYLANIVLPDVALVTNISVSHFTEFKSFMNIIKAKGLIFNYLKNSGIAIVNKDIKYLFFWDKYFDEKKIIYFSYNRKLGVDIFLLDVVLTNIGSYLTIYIFSEVIKVFFRLLGIHNIFNVLSSVSLAVSVGISLKDIVLGLESCLPVKGRLYPIYLDKDHVVLDDTYNSNPRSMYYSIVFLSRFDGYNILVVSDMSELGICSIKSHVYIGNLIRNLNIDKVLSLGFYSYYISKYSYIGEHFSKMSNLIVRLKHILLINNKVTVLIKGSRIFSMDKIIKFL